MSDIDNATPDSVASNPVAPPPGGESPDTTQANANAADTAVPGESEPKRDRRVEKRISRLTQQREAAVREAGYWRGMAEARASGTDPSADGSQQQQQTRQAPAADHGEAEHSKSVLERIREAGEDHEDFDDVMETLTSDDFRVSRTMRDFIGESDKPYDLAKWLTDNPKEATRIARLDPAVAVRALEKAEARLATKPAARTTNTPPPPPTASGRGTPQISLESASMEDFVRIRNEQRAKAGYK